MAKKIDAKNVDTIKKTDTMNKDIKNNLNKMKQAKLRSIQNAIKSLEKSTKKEGLICRLGDKPQVNIEATSTGSLMFDLALGVGGFPKGRIIELFG